MFEVLFYSFFNIISDAFINLSNKLIIKHK